MNIYSLVRFRNHIIFTPDVGRSGANTRQWVLRKGTLKIVKLPFCLSFTDLPRLFSSPNDCVGGVLGPTIRRRQATARPYPADRLPPASLSPLIDSCTFRLSSLTNNFADHNLVRRELLLELAVRITTSVGSRHCFRLREHLRRRSGHRYDRRATTDRMPPTSATIITELVAGTFPTVSRPLLFGTNSN